MTRPTLLAVALTLFAAPAWALGEDDKTFLLESSEGAQYELALARLAQQKATRPDVKGYAARLVSDHSTENPALDRLLAAKGVTPSVGIKDEDHMRLNDLSNQTGPAFDGRFVAEAVRINAEDKKSSAKEKSSTRDADIKAFLSRFASIDAEHEKAALALQKK